jgi:ribose/xylose/arabinose/galactoside ABC-type transport system permease subunit
MRSGGIYWLLAGGLVAALAGIPSFRSPDNLANVIMQSAALGVIAVGQTLVIVGGMIDLSVGQLLGLTVVLVCAVMDGRPEMTLPAILLAVGLGAGCGLANGLLVTRLRVHPLILTFGTLSVLQGAIFSYTDRSVGRASAQLGWLASGEVLGIPVAALVLLTAGLTGFFLLERTRFGRHLCAVGGNEESARRSGLDVPTVKVMAFVGSGISAGLAGLIVAGRLGTGYPNAGQGFELDAIAAVVLGGTSLAGGRGSMAGTIAAVILLGIVSNAMNLLEVFSFLQMLIKGLIVIAAIMLTPQRILRRG